MSEDRGLSARVNDDDDSSSLSTNKDISSNFLEIKINFSWKII